MVLLVGILVNIVRDPAAAVQPVAVIAAVAQPAATPIAQVLFQLTQIIPVIPVVQVATQTVVVAAGNQVHYSTKLKATLTGNAKPD